MHYKISDHFNTTVEQFWAVFFHEDYNNELYRHLMIDRTVMRIERSDDGSIVRIQKLVPKRTTPPLIKRIAKGDISYTERLEYCPKKSAAKIVTTPSFMTGTLTASGVFAVEPNPDGVTRAWTAVCKCDIPFVGGKIEKHIVSEIRLSYARSTKFTQRWLSTLVDGD